MTELHQRATDHRPGPAPAGVTMDDDAFAGGEPRDDEVRREERLRAIEHRIVGLLPGVEILQLDRV